MKYVHRFNYYRKLINPIHSDDIFFASYPKSGNTWLRFIFSYLKTGCKKELDFKEVDKIIPEYGLHNKYVKALSRPRLLKTHLAYHSRMKKAVYMVRNPKDVYVSYYHYLQKKLPEGTTISDFVRNSGFRAYEWDEHVESWHKNSDALVIKYEDLLSKTTFTVHRILEHFSHLPIDPNLVDKAIELSSFEKMKKIEQEKGRGFLTRRNEERSTTFLRKGKKGSWKQELSKEDVHIILKRSRKWMNRLGYR